MTQDQRGVSEAIGFIIILSVIVTSIAIVTLYGYPLLLKQQGATDVRNMEQTMIVLQNDVKSLAYKNVPYKETTIQVSGGVLSVLNATGTPQSLTISTDSGGWTPYTFSPGTISYHSDTQNTIISLENGAVITREEFTSGSSMLAEPRWFFDENSGMLVIYLLEINTTRERAISGMGAVRMHAEILSPQQDDAGPFTVNVTYLPAAGADTSVAWKNYLTSQVGMENPATNIYTRDNVLTLVVKHYQIFVDDL